MCGGSYAAYRLVDKVIGVAVWVFGDYQKRRDDIMGVPVHQIDQVNEISLRI